MRGALATQAPRPALTSRLRQALDWYRQRGAGWLVRRIRDELVAPRSKLLRGLRGSLASAPAGADERTLYFFFDLHLCPLAYDIATYMAGAELERRRLGLASVHVVFVPGQVDGLRLELPAYDAAVDADARRSRLHNLVVPVTGLLPACSGYTLCGSRTEAEALFRDRTRHVYPGAWRPGLPVAPVARAVRDAARAGEPVFPLLQAPAAALGQADRYLAAHAAGREPVVITLREYAYTPARNSNVDAWVAFADGLDARRYAAIFVPDTEKSLDPLPEGLRRHLVLDAAAWNVHLRMALYERAYLNLAVVHGPMELCWYNEHCRYLLFCPVNTAALTTEEVLGREGFEVGGQLPFARPWQRWVWEADDLLAIRREFAGMHDVLEAPR